MNYESSPFQGYSSISVDDLKDQANSLLNLVTEEQRPLRVFMNNSKEFFLFPQDMLAPISDSDFRLILLSAMRYAMRRKTHMSSVVADYLKRHIQLLDNKFLTLAADDIQRFFNISAIVQLIMTITAQRNNVFLGIQRNIKKSMAA